MSADCCAGASEGPFDLAVVGAELLSVEADPQATAAEVMALAENKLGDIEEKIRALQRMRRALRKVVEGCPGRGDTSGCSILQSLNEPPR